MYQPADQLHTKSGAEQSAALGLLEGVAVDPGGSQYFRHRVDLGEYFQYFPRHGSDRDHHCVLDQKRKEDPDRKFGRVFSRVAGLCDLYRILFRNGYRSICTVFRWNLCASIWLEGIGRGRVISGYEKRNVNLLSGGQQQRIAIARAIVNEPAVLLLDEPLAALDLKLRKDMQLELKNMQKELGITFIYVTHDQEEALTMSDTVVVMKDGRIQQIGTPEDIYNEPKNAYVADFIGESNIIDGVMKKDCLVNIMGIDFECVDKGFNENESVDVVIRPEDIYIVDDDKSEFKGIVESVTFKGVHYEMVINCYDKKWIVHDTTMFPVDKNVGLIVKPFDIHIMKKGEE